MRIVVEEYLCVLCMFVVCIVVCVYVLCMYVVGICVLCISVCLCVFCVYVHTSVCVVCLCPSLSRAED